MGALCVAGRWLAAGRSLLGRSESRDWAKPAGQVLMGSLPVAACGCLARYGQPGQPSSRPSSTTFACSLRLAMCSCSPFPRCDRFPPWDSAIGGLGLGWASVGPRPRWEEWHSAVRCCARRQRGAAPTGKNRPRHTRRRRTRGGRSVVLFRTSNIDSTESCHSSSSRCPRRVALLEPDLTFLFSVCFQVSTPSAP